MNALPSIHTHTDENHLARGWIECQVGRRLYQMERGRGVACLGAAYTRSLNAWCIAPEGRRFMLQPGRRPCCALCVIRAPTGTFRVSHELGFPVRHLESSILCDCELARTTMQRRRCCDCCWVSLVQHSDWRSAAEHGGHDGDDYYVALVIRAYTCKLSWGLARTGA